MKRKTVVLVILASATALAQNPVITAVLDAASYTPGIPQGAVFVVKGTNLASASLAGAPPYGKSLNAVGVTFQPLGGGTAIQAYMVYTFSEGGVTQLAALMPSTTATGDYNVTVTTGSGTSAAFRATVVARKFGIMTQPGTGSGRALVQNAVTASQYDLNAFTSGTVPGRNFLRSPAKPGEFLIAWGIGLGAAAAFDETAPASGLDFLPTQHLDLKVIVGTTEITPLYAGRSNLFPGLDNINFQLPSNISLGCTVNLQVRVAGQLSNATTIAIAPTAQADACVDPRFGRDTLSGLDTGGTVAAGFFNLNSLRSKLTIQGQTLASLNESISGLFARYNADQLSRLTAPALSASAGCQVSLAIASDQARATDAIPVIDLDAGVLTLSGPNLTNQELTRLNDVYSLSLSNSTAPPGAGGSSVLASGTYTLSGTGGQDVGAFTASIKVNPPLTLTGDLPATVVRSQDLKIAWTGGANDTVVIMGSASALASGTPGVDGIYNIASFLCTTTADKGSLTVPAAILQQLPATPATNGSTSLSVFNGSQPDASSGNGFFTAPLIAGGAIDYGIFLATLGSSAAPIYQ